MHLIYSIVFLFLFLFYFFVKRVEVHILKPAIENQMYYYHKSGMVSNIFKRATQYRDNLMLCNKINLFMTE